MKESKDIQKPQDHANNYNGALPDPTVAQTFKIDIQQLPEFISVSWSV